MKDVDNDLCVSTNTVKTHHVYAKLDVNDAVECLAP